MTSDRTPSTGLITYVVQHRLPPPYEHLWKDDWDYGSSAEAFDSLRREEAARGVGKVRLVKRVTTEQVIG